MTVLVRPILVALSLLSLMDCSANAPPPASNSGADNGQAAGSVSPPPPIHYDQTAVLTVGGQPQEELSYRASLDDCQKAGHPTHALTPADVAKIGRVHVEAWIGAEKQSRHDEEWHLASSGTCQFSLSHLDQTQSGDASGRTTVIDGVTHKVDVQELGKTAPTPLPAEDGEISEGERQAGWSKSGTANENGSQCVIWRDSAGFELCVWAGGRQWGYSADGPTALKDGVSRGDSVVLWTHPDQGTSWKLETREFSVGQALDRRAFEVPANTTQGSSP